MEDIGVFDEAHAKSEGNSILKKERIEASKDEV